MRCKKLSAVLLAAALCVNMISVQAFAYSDETETAVTTEEKAAETDVLDNKETQKETVEKGAPKEQLIGTVTTDGSCLNVRTGSSGVV